MLKPLLACVFASLLTMPGCGKSERAAPPPTNGVRIGKAAPELAGVDLEDSPLKLSDFRGKVVALSFWAGWCGPCVNLIPHEKELQAKFADRPFVLIGANGDETREEGLAVQRRHQVTWRSVFLGGPDSPITGQWGLTGWPTIFLIDAKGIVRHKFVGGQPTNVERAVEMLLRELDDSKS